MTHSDEKRPKSDAVYSVMVEIQKDMLRMLTRRLGNPDEAADVLQDFYAKVLARMGDVKDTEKLRGWMRRVLETTLIDYYRAQGKRRSGEAEFGRLEQGLERSEDPDDLDFAICMCLYKLLPTLKSEYADVLWRADLMGQQREEILAELGLSDSNLRVRLHRARQALRQRLQETCQVCPIHGFLSCGDDCVIADQAKRAKNRS
ncbi:MAG: sigma-70 family RNA polymerase sigma factor [Alphaproteobacteria bacterium]|nr:sigma-70 family RNA polymerase sigma factor [Alphaproteobacteria bacterium]